MSDMKKLIKLIETQLIEDSNIFDKPTDKIDTVTIDVPLLIRMLEYAREDANTDMDLHDVAERMIALAKGGVLNMDDYTDIMGKDNKNVEEGQYSDKMDAYIAKLEAKPKLTKQEQMKLQTTKDYREQRKKKSAELDEASWTAAASGYAATRKRGPQSQDPKHDFRVGHSVITRNGGKSGEVVFVDGEKIHVKGTNTYYPDRVTHHTASDLKKGVAEAVDLDEANYVPGMFDLSKNNTRKLQTTYNKMKDSKMSDKDKAVFAALKKELEDRGAMKESDELDELNTSTLRSYNAKASDEAGELRRTKDRTPEQDKKRNNRIKGQQRAMNKMTSRHLDAKYGTKKESFEQFDEKLDKEDLFHKSVENGKFMTHKAGGSGDPNTLYLHDLDQKGSDGKSPMMVTFAHTDKNRAERAAKKFGGKLFKTRFGTFRIIKESVELDEADVCPQCGSADCTCKPGECDCEPVKENNIDLTDLRKLAGLSEADDSESCKACRGKGHKPATHGMDRDCEKCDGTGKVAKEKVAESYPMDAYGVQGDSEDTTLVNYSQTKRMGDATVTVSANAHSMEELHKVLQLAGLDPAGAEKHLPVVVEPQPEPKADYEPPSACGCDGSSSLDDDPRYTTDKAALVDMIKQRMSDKFYK